MPGIHECGAFRRGIVAPTGSWPCVVIGIEATRALQQPPQTRRRFVEGHQGGVPFRALHQVRELGPRSGAEIEHQT